MKDKIKPCIIRLEASTHCQLRCPSCPTAKGTIRQNLGARHLSFKTFKSILDHNNWIKQVELSNWGEMFLNPNLLKMMEYALKKRVKLTAFNGVNMNYIKPEVLAGLVRYQFYKMTCSIDGVTQTTYEKYRIKGNIKKVFENIKTINNFKREMQSEFPKLTFQYIIFKHNFHEIAEAKRLAKSLNMKIEFKLSWDKELSPDSKDAEWIKNETGLDSLTRDEFQERHGRIYNQKQICSQLWNTPQINVDGRLLGCCVNYWGDFGRYDGGDLLNSLNGEKMAYARRMLMGQKNDRTDIPCSQCKYYKRMKQGGDWVQKSSVDIRSLLAATLHKG